LSSALLRGFDPLEMTIFNTALIIKGSTMIASLLTAKDLLQLKGDARYELLRGELITLPFREIIRGRIAVIVGTSLHSHAAANQLGVVYAAGTGFLIATDPDTVRAPDVAFIRRERLEKVGPVEGYWPGAPDLVVEVISPNDHYTEVESKVFDWLEAGTSMVIVVNPRNHAATLYRSFDDITLLTEDDTLRGEPVVPGWEMRVEEMFEE
jgi:Uma2 family endonuclease